MGDTIIEIGGLDLLFYIGTAVICLSPLILGILITTEKKK